MYVLAAQPLGWMPDPADGSHRHAKCVIRTTPAADGFRLLDKFRHGMLWVKRDKAGWRDGADI